MYADRRLSIVIPAYNEEATIADVVRDLRDWGGCDEVLVVDNRSADATADRARQAGARVVREERPGYGAALRRGIEESTGQWIALTEADGSFRAADLPRVLDPLRGPEPPDLVVGSRTGADAPPRARLRGASAAANRLVAQLLRLHGRPQGAGFTDVGCTLRAMPRETWERLAPHLIADGPEFAPEMVVAALRLGQRVLERSVAYHPRGGGVSKHGDGPRALARTAGRMVRLIVARRLGALPRRA